MINIRTTREGDKERINALFFLVRSLYEKNTKLEQENKELTEYIDYLAEGVK